ncbi:Hypothetical predicted protein [Paramuricea clavata]|uniref:Uncharacterized protein n=1 Tax=Paramuricea clavata TaxID=317549 RepID=A0A7D9HR43_PARCT|nr:Hypothetical predicted protein [Paramuricea clavata]
MDLVTPINKQVVEYVKECLGFKGSEKYAKLLSCVGGIVQGEWSRRPMMLSPGASYRQRGYGKKQQGGILPLLLGMLGMGGQRGGRLKQRGGFVGKKQQGGSLQLLKIFGRQ